MGQSFAPVTQGAYCFAIARHLLEINFSIYVMFKFLKDLGTTDLQQNFRLFLFRNTIHRTHYKI